MKKASITEAKNQLSALIRGLKSGPVLIVDRGRPVARLEAAGAAEGNDDGRLAWLVRAGVVRPPRKPLRRSIMTTRPPKLRSGVSAVQLLLEERHEGR